MDTHRELPEIERKGKKLDIQRVFPITNHFHSMTQAMVQVRCDFTSFVAVPDVLVVDIINLTGDGSHIIRLTDSQLDELVRNIDQFRAELYEEYFYPTTDCCETKRPRDEVDTKNVRNGFYCLEGYGCRANHKKEGPCQGE